MKIRDALFGFAGYTIGARGRLREMVAKSLS